MDNNESPTEKLNTIYFKSVSRFISDFLEIGYNSFDEFVEDAVLKLLTTKGLEIGKLQTWMKR